MKKKKYVPIRFCAVLPKELCEQLLIRTILKREYDLLPPEGRDQYMSSSGRVVYQSVKPIPPFPNPALDAVRRKLKRHPFTEREIIRDGRVFVEIRTIDTGEDLV